MSSFADHVARANAEIFGRLGEPIVHVPAATGAPAQIRGQLRRPHVTDQIRSLGVTRERPAVHVPISEAILRKGDTLEIDGRRYRVAEPPQRPGQGFVQVAEVEALAPGD